MLQAAHHVPVDRFYLLLLKPKNYFSSPSDEIALNNPMIITPSFILSPWQHCLQEEVQDNRQSELHR
jgi:hypothetical protein